MKKFFDIILTLSLTFAMTACGNSEQKVTAENLAKTTTSAKTSTAASEKAESKSEIGEENSLKNNIEFNFETKTVTLNSGYEMPIYGLGTYSLEGEECVQSVTAALENGVQLIDTAYMYHNEESVGEAVRNSGIPREEIFVITKLYPNQFSDPENAIEQALEKLDIDYIDMMLLHHPTGSDKRYSFSIVENPNIPSVHLFESAIDLLSYATLLIMQVVFCSE